jgi:hypothetical protein
MKTLFLKNTFYISFLSWVAILCLVACSPQDRKSRDFIAEGMKSRKIKRVTDVKLLTAVDDFGKKTVAELQKIVLSKIEIDKFNCQVHDYVSPDKKFIYVSAYRLVCKTEMALFDKEKQVFEAYQHDSQQDKDLTDNIQKINDEAIIYTSPFTLNGQFKGMWTIVMDKKELIKNIN